LRKHQGEIIVSIGENRHLYSIISNLFFQENTCDMGCYSPVLILLCYMPF